MATNATHFGVQIDGVDRPGARTEPLVDPASAAEIGTVSVGDGGDVALAVESASRAFEGGWRDTLPLERGRVLMNIARAIEANAEALADSVMRNTGHPRAFALADAANAARYFEYYAGSADKIHGETIPVGPNHIDFTLAEPWGVCAVITPFNAPLQLLARSVAPALAAGNTVVAKPADQAPAPTLALGHVIRDAGLAPGVVNIVAGGLDVGHGLIAHRDVSHVTFTGSVEVGKAIMRGAAEGIKPVTLELGGKSPQVVFDDGDVPALVSAVVGSAIVTAGQVCSAGTRILVQDRVHGQLVDALLEAIGRVTVGPPVEGAQMGPVITAAQRDRIRLAIAAGRKDGARVIIGGEDPPAGLEQGFFVQPTILDDVPPTSSLATNEVFGPVLAVMRFRDTEHALELANESDFGLVAGVWTGDSSRAMYMARRLQAGQVFVNNYGVGGGVELPFGGYKQSGIGREKGLAGLREYTQIKNVCVLAESR